MTTIRRDYASKTYRCPDEAAESFAWMLVCAIVTALLWWFDVAVWSA